jgi:organic radical activating enzyme
MIKYSEIFASFQGEGPYAGIPCLWVRFFGCNLECNGFGQKDPLDENPELPYKTVDISSIKKIEDLPVFNKGCDSSYSWSNRFKHLAPKATAQEIVDKLVSLGVERFGLEESAKETFFSHPKTKQDVYLVFTGGEPMLWQSQMVEILKEIAKRFSTIPKVTIETNGTKELEPEFKNFLHDWYHDNFIFSVSPKLRNTSGEKDAIKPEVLKSYQQYNGYFKFVCNCSEKSWEELENVLSEVYIEDSNWSIWVMPVGAVKEDQEGPDVAVIVDEAMRRGYRVATRNHVHVYGNVIGS